MPGFGVFSQVVNVEQARANADSLGWKVSLDVSYFRQQFSEDLTTINGRFSAQKKDSKIYMLYLLDAGYSHSEDQVFANYKLGHLRCSMKVAAPVRWEGFLQVQDNKPLGIQIRGLVGSGPRIRVISEEKGRVYVGITAMLEYEEAINGVNDGWMLRSSNYVNMSWTKDTKFGISSTFYFQPRYSDFRDYRVSGQHALVYALTDKINGKTEYTHYYDSRPPSEGLNRSRMTTFGLVYAFE